MGISNHHFDTHFPIPPPEPTSQLASENFCLPYLTLFRQTHLLGCILDDVNDVVKPMTPERAAEHDLALQTWRESWPPDLELTEYAIATSLARTQEEGAQRRGMQALHLMGTLNLSILAYLADIMLKQALSTTSGSCFTDPFNPPGRTRFSRCARPL